MPLGKMVPSPLDGREPFEVKKPEAIIAASQPYLRSMSIDYDHETDSNGSSRAAAWIVELADKGPNGEPGIWGRCEWTKCGAESVESREYRFLSPSFYHDPKTREVRFIVRAALTNNPALVLKALASIQTEEQSLNEFLKKLAAMLGLDPETATEADVISAIEALAKSKGAPAELSVRNKQLCSIAKAAGQPDDAAKINDAVVNAICATLSAAPDGEVAALKDRLADVLVENLSLKSGRDERSAEQRIDDAIAAGQLTPAQRSEAIELCKISPEKFSKLIAGSEKSVLATRVTPAKRPEEGDGVALDDAQLAICRMTGTDPKKYAEQLKADARKKDAA